MKKCLLLATCLILAGCAPEGANNREVISQIAALRAELAEVKGAQTNQPPLRWAYANKNEISTAIFQWSREKMEALKASEKLPAETEEKVARYEALNSQLMRMRSGMMMSKHMPRPPGYEPPATDEEFEALQKKVAEAKEPVAAIVERHARQSSQYYSQYTVERLVAEYAKDRFDLVLDSNSKALYCAGGEVMDITEGVLQLFEEKAKP